MKSTLPVILSVLFLSACGTGSEGGGSDAGTTTGSPDAGGNTGSDAGTQTPTCTASSSYSGPIAGTAKVVNPGTTGEALTFVASLPGSDRLVVAMYSQFGTAGYHTGTYDMSDRTKVLETITTNISGSAWVSEYKPTVGTLNVTSVSGKFSGTITGATFTSANEPGCSVSVSSLTFEATIQ